MAYYNNAGGLYLACDDATGLPKFIDRVMEDDGVTLGVAHYPGTRGPSETKLPYNVVVGTFHGDWYSAAEIYSGLGIQTVLLWQEAGRQKRPPKMDHQFGGGNRVPDARPGRLGRAGHPKP